MITNVYFFMGDSIDEITNGPTMYEDIEDCKNDLAANIEDDPDFTDSKIFKVTVEECPNS